MFKILSTLENLKQLLKGDPSLSMLLERTRLDDSDSDSSTVSTDRPRLNRPQSTPTTVCAAAGCHSVGNKSNRVEKWGLKFTGDKHLSVSTFLERVSELRIARGISERELFDSAIDLFSGRALNWFRANRHRFVDWKGLSSLLCKHFEPPDYRSRLFREILDRTQDRSESIVDYLSSMSALFRRYGGISEDVQLDIVTRNLSPFYTTQLPIVNSMEELEEECLKLEAKKYRAESYVPPARKRHGFVEPDFAFIAADEPSVHLSNDSIPDVSEVAQAGSKVLTSRTVTCWNCGKTGHLNRQCPNPKNTHCYRCGAPGVTTRSCQKCSPSGNGSRESR